MHSFTNLAFLNQTGQILKSFIPDEKIWIRKLQLKITDTIYIINNNIHNVLF